MTITKVTGRLTHSWEAWREGFSLLDDGLKIIKRSVGGIAEQASFTEMEHPAVRTGKAIWCTKDADIPITVVAYLGMKSDRHFVKIEEGNGGVPLDEIRYEE